VLERVAIIAANSDEHTLTDYYPATNTAPLWANWCADPTSTTNSRKGWQLDDFECVIKYDATASGFTKD